MRTIAEVIKRLYQSGRLTKAEVAQRVEKGTITQQEYDEIMTEK